MGLPLFRDWLGISRLVESNLGILHHLFFPGSVDFSLYNFLEFLVLWDFLN